MSGQRCPLKNTSIAVGNFVEFLVPHTICPQSRALGRLPAATITSLHAVRLMIMLTGIKAFEARWQSLKDHYPTSPDENRLLMQSMGRLVDNYATQEELLDELPGQLCIIFNRLVDAYLNGVWMDDSLAEAYAGTGGFGPRTERRSVSREGMTPAMLAAQKLRRQPKAATEASEAATYIVETYVASERRRSSWAACAS